MKILLGVTGSVAATLTRKLQDFIIEKGYELETVVTESAINFYPLYDNDPSKYWLGFKKDSDEWSYYKNEKKVLHIDLVKWADVFIVAPCTANTLSKIANGICDNLLTSCVRAWDWEKKIIIAPSMNTYMYNKSITEHHRRMLYSSGNGFVWVPPQSKKLYCGDDGIGAMANIEDIIAKI